MAVKATTQLITKTTEEALQAALPFWSELSSQDQKLLIQHARQMCYEQGEQITGSAAECLGGILVGEGSVRIYLMSEEGREVTIARIRPGEPCLMAASCVLNSIAFDVFMEAEQKSVVTVISPQALNEVFSHDLRVENWALNSLIDRFSDVMWNMQQMLFLSFDRRLATFLYEESTRTGSSEIRMTHDTIAKLLGSAREVVSRMLSYFADEGLVKVGRGRVEICDPARLKALALGA